MRVRKHRGGVGGTCSYFGKLTFLFPWYFETVSAGWFNLTPHKHGNSKHKVRNHSRVSLGNKKSFFIRNTSIGSLRQTRSNCVFNMVAYFANSALYCHTWIVLRLHSWTFWISLSHARRCDQDYQATTRISLTYIQTYTWRSCNRRVCSFAQLNNEYCICSVCEENPPC